MKNNNYIHRTSYIRSSIAYDHDFFIHLCKMMISPGVFFILSKIWLFGLLRWISIQGMWVARLMQFAGEWFFSISIWVNKNQQGQSYAGSQVYPLLSTSMGVSPLHGLIAASLRISQIYMKIGKVKIKPYLHPNHSIG